MPAAAEGPDTEDLKISPFARGEWSQDERIMLDVSFTSLAAVLGDEDDPLESIAVSRLLAIAYAVGWSSKMLMVSPTDFAGELEAAIDARGGLQDIGNVADANLATAQAVATDQIQFDAIKLYAAMYGTIGAFADRVTALRPSRLTDVYTVDAIRQIMAWFDEMRRYEADARSKAGSGLKLPDDLVLDDEYVQPAARGRAWYLIDHIRTGGAAPIVPLEEAEPLAPVIHG